MQQSGTRSVSLHINTQNQTRFVIVEAVKYNVKQHENALSLGVRRSNWIHWHINADINAHVLE